MRLRIEFGKSLKSTITWWNTLSAFPKLLEYQNKKWEWVMYDSDKDKKVDNILYFSEIPSFDPTWHMPMDKFENMSGYKENSNCECGAGYTSFAQFHYKWCPLWTSK